MASNNVSYDTHIQYIVSFCLSESFEACREQSGSEGELSPKTHCVTVYISQFERTVNPLWGQKNYKAFI